MYPRIPLISLIKYTLNKDPDDFLNEFYYPDETTRGDFLDYFLLEYGEFTPIYQQPDLLITHINAIAKSLKYSIDKLYATLSLEYNPRENYDRHENTQDDITTDEEGSGSKNSTLTYAGGETTTYAGGETTAYNGGETTTFAGGVTTAISGSETDTRQPHTIEHKVAADNTDTYYKSTADIEDGDTNTKSFTDRADTSTFNNRSDSKQYNQRSDVMTYNDRSDTRAFNNRYDVTAETESGDKSSVTQNIHQGRIHGNIGVTTSQQMIKSEREDVALFNFIDEVSYLYAEKLCILLY